MNEEWPKGTFVTYIPGHAHGDSSHADCEDGIVTSCNEVNVFVRYGSEMHSKATSPEDLYRR